MRNYFTRINIRLHLTDQIFLHVFRPDFAVFLSQLNARNVKMIELCKKYTRF